MSSLNYSFNILSATDPHSYHFATYYLSVRPQRLMN